jgi:hypothetical protein
MKKKPDPLLVLAVIVVLGIIGSSLFQGSEQRTVQDEHGLLAVAQK